ncbi:MAG: ABC transporter transmembrane domain-containing protein [Chloroflexota bacterium]
MGFLMDGLDAEAYDRAYSDQELLKRIINYFRPHGFLMGFVAIMIVLNSLMSAVLPVLIARGLDILTQEGFSRQTAIWLLSAILVSGILAWIFNFIREWYTARTVGDVVLKLRKDGFEAVMARDLSFYDEFSSGKIVSRVTSDTQDFATVVTLTFNLVSQLLLVIIILGILFSINVRLALTALAIAPFIILAAHSFRRIARETTQQARRILAQVNAKVQETITGISVAKTFRQEQTIYDEFTEVNAQSYTINLRQGYVFSSIFPILGTIAGIGTALLVYFGGISVLNETVSAGDWFLFLEGLSLFWFPLTSIASFWSQFQLGLSASERVFALIDAQPQVIQTDDQPAPQLKGQIEFQDVGFSYTDQETASC